MIKVDNAGLMTGQYWMSIKGTWLEDQSTGHYRDSGRRAGGGLKHEEPGSTSSGHDPHLPAPLAKEARRPSWTPGSLNNPNATEFDPPWALNSGTTFQLQSHLWSTKESFWLKTNTTQENAVFTAIMAG